MIDLHFTERDWERAERDYSAWWAGELERPLVTFTHIGRLPDGSSAAAESFVTNYPLDMPVDDLLDRVQTQLEHTRFFGDALPRWWVNFGPGIMAGFLGAKVTCVRDTVWFSPSAPGPIDAVRPAYDAANWWWRRIRDITARAVERFAPQVQVCHTDLGGNMDIVASLRGSQRLLLDVIDSPEEVDRLVAAVTPLWLRYYDELDAIIRPACRGTAPWAPIWSPGRCYMLQSDFSYMISPRMFERFVLPDLVACCDALDHGFYHMDGKGQTPHLDNLLGIARLRGIQWQPGDGAPRADGWLPLLKRIRDAGKLCQVYVTAAGARTIVRELGGRGFLFDIVEEIAPEDAQDLLKELYARR